MKSLKKLSLEFLFNDKLSDQAMTHLKLLESLIGLEELLIDLTSCENIGDEGVFHLMEGIKCLSSLKKLRLELTRLPISDIELVYIGEGITKLTNLREFTFDLEDCEDIGTEGLTSLSMALKVLSALRKLDLEFSWGPIISDEGIEILATCLKELKRIDNLKLSFNQVDNNRAKITDKGLKGLMGGLVEMKALRTLYLGLQAQVNITDKGLDYLENGLKLMPGLELLEINFDHCFVISKKRIAEFAEGMLVNTWVISHEQEREDVSSDDFLYE